MIVSPSETPVISVTFLVNNKLGVAGVTTGKANTQADSVGGVVLVQYNGAVTVGGTPTVSTTIVPKFKAVGLGHFGKVVQTPELVVQGLGPLLVQFICTQYLYCVSCCNPNVSGIAKPGNTFSTRNVVELFGVGMPSGAVNGAALI